MPAAIKQHNQGTHRALPVSETLLRILPMAPQFGVTRVANVTGLDVLGIPVYVVCRPNSKSLSVFQGKGITKEAAQVSGIMEAIECYHAENPNVPVYTGSMRSISNNGNVADITRFAKLNTKPFADSDVIQWVFGQDLLNHSAAKLVPFTCVHNDYTTDCNRVNEGFFISDTNGLASGNTKEEAINHALSEVIERDALALWSLATPQHKISRKLDLGSIGVPFVQDCVSKMHDAGMLVAIWDLTSDIGIPTFMCKILPSEHEFASGVRPAYGSGTHASKEVALLRAVTEAAQSRLTFISGARDDQYQSVYQSQTGTAVYERWRQEINTGSGPRRFQEIATLETEDLFSDQRYLLNQLRGVGIDEAICVDLTQAEYGIPIVKVIVPGLEGISYSGQRILGERGRQAYFERQRACA